MTRTIVGFEPLGTDTVLKLEDFPQDIPGIGDNATVDVTPLAAGNAKVRGLELLTRLRTNATVIAGLDQILTLPTTSAPAPLYFHLVSRAADELPWEELYVEQHGFCALDRRWPVARIGRRHRDLRPRVYDAPLHIVAVISAARQSGVGQLQAILASLAEADPIAMGVTLHVISGEQAVLDLADGPQADGVKVSSEKIAGTSPAVVRQIAAARPDVLHLLCHGGVVDTARTLAFATVGDFAADEHETGSVQLFVKDLVDAVSTCDPWLIVLAACETAAASDGTAMAHDLVIEPGIPAVIGMRRLVDLTAVERFCAAFYPEALSLVRATVDGDGDAERTLDWAAALTAPRVVLGSPDPVLGDSWSDPVLYVQDDNLRIAIPPKQLPVDTYESLRGQLDTWEKYLASQDLSAISPAVLSEVTDRIVKLRAELSQP